MNKLTPEQKAQRLAIPDEDYGFAETPTGDADDRCATCGSPVRLIDPAQVAHLNRTYFLDMKKAWGIDAVLAGYAFMCLECDALTLEPDVPLAD